MISVVYAEEKLLKSIIHGKLMMLYMFSLLLSVVVLVSYIYVSLTGLDFAYKLLYETFSLDEVLGIVIIVSLIEIIWIYCNVNIPCQHYFEHKVMYKEFIRKCWAGLPYGNELLIMSLPWTVYVGIVLIINNL